MMLVVSNVVQQGEFDRGCISDAVKEYVKGFDLSQEDSEAVRTNGHLSDAASWVIEVMVKGKGRILL